MFEKYRHVLIPYIANMKGAEAHFQSGPSIIEYTPESTETLTLSANRIVPFCSEFIFKIGFMSAGMDPRALSGKQFLCVLKIKEEDVLNMYLYGSRLFEPSRVRPDTDYDLLIVVRSSSRWKAVQSLHRNNLDATILTDAEFEERIKSGSILEWSLLLILQSHLLPEKFRPKKLAAPPLELLKKSVLERYERDKIKATKFREKGKQAEAFKIWNHAFRNFKMARQIIELGTITEFEGLSLGSNVQSACQAEALEFSVIECHGIPYAQLGHMEDQE